MRRYYGFLLLLMIFVSGCKQEKYNVEIDDFRSSLSLRLRKLEKLNQLPYSDTNLRSYFIDSCKREEIIAMMNCEIPIIRVVGYQAIVNRNDTGYFNILLNHLDDTAKVTYWVYDDVVGEFNVSDLMISKAEYEGKLDKNQKRILVDKVLTEHTYLSTADEMIKDIEPHEKYYAIIKNQAKKDLRDCHDLSYTYALAKFKKKEDVDFIKNLISVFSDNTYCNNQYNFKSIEIFPDTAFYPVLENYLKNYIKKKKQWGSDELEIYPRAVAQYKTKRSLEILTELTDSTIYSEKYYIKFNKEFVFRAIHKYPDPIYEELYEKLKPEMRDYIIDYIDKPDWRERTKTW